MSAEDIAAPTAGSALPSVIVPVSDFRSITSFAPAPALHAPETALVFEAVIASRSVHWAPEVSAVVVTVIVAAWAAAVSVSRTAVRADPRNRMFLMRSFMLSALLACVCDEIGR